jgi:hypothetical protein
MAPAICSIFEFGILCTARLNPVDQRTVGTRVCARVSYPQAMQRFVHRFRTARFGLVTTLFYFVDSLTG